MEQRVHTVALYVCSQPDSPSYTYQCDGITCPRHTKRCNMSREALRTRRRGASRNATSSCHRGVLGVSGVEEGCSQELTRKRADRSTNRLTSLDEIPGHSWETQTACRHVRRLVARPHSARRLIEEIPVPARAMPAAAQKTRDAAVHAGALRLKEDIHQRVVCSAMRAFRAT
eukprot:7314678-Prymnesium_polylepis.1